MLRPLIAALLLATPAFADPLDDYFADWSTRAQAALESEPHWIPPINTITPRLTQVVRWDQNWQSANNASATDLFDSGKGVEIIPLETTSITFNLPAYDQRMKKSVASGFGDWTPALFKQLFASAPGDDGYVLTGLFSFQAPIGSSAFTNHAWLVTPGIGGGKGWGEFDLEGTLTAAFPLSHAGTIGTAIAANAVAQWHMAKYLWPEVELNDTTWSGGARDGKNQLFVTVGSLFGNFPIMENYAVGIGAGYQFALSPHPVTPAPLTPTYDHEWTLTLRLVY